MQKGDEPVKSTSRQSLRLLGTVGEPINPEAWRWYHQVVGEGRCPVVDTWWQTETGGILISPLPGATNLKPGSATLPFFGVQPALVDNEGHELAGATEGNLVIKDSWPGQMRTVYGDHERFVQTYFSTFKGMYFTGDGARRDADGYYWIIGRVDDVINVSGHRMRTAEVESSLVAHPAVAEAAVVGFPHDLKGQGVYCYVTLHASVEPSEDLRQDLVKHVRQDIGPIASPDYIQWAPGLPKTRSGKIMRRILRKIAANEYDELGDTSSLAAPPDPAADKELLNAVVASSREFAHHQNGQREGQYGHPSATLWPDEWRRRAREEAERRLVEDEAYVDQPHKEVDNNALIEYACSELQALDLQKKEKNKKIQLESMHEKSPQRSRVSFAWPRLLSKGRSALFVFHIYPDEAAERAARQIQNFVKEYDLTEIRAESAHFIGEQISVEPKCPVICFMPNEATLKIEPRICKIHFTGIALESCVPQKHVGILHIKNAKTGDNLESLDFRIEIVDYAFDHVSRPLISWVSSGTLALAATASFTLTFLQEIDKTFGMTAGTGAAGLTAIILSWGILPFSRTEKVQGRVAD